MLLLADSSGFNPRKGDPHRVAPSENRCSGEKVSSGKSFFFLIVFQPQISFCEVIYFAINVLLAFAEASIFFFIGHLSTPSISVDVSLLQFWAVLGEFCWFCIQFFVLLTLFIHS